MEEANTEVLLAMSIFDTVYGIFGLFGKMSIPEKFQNHEWTKNYMKEISAAYILLGIPYLILYFALQQYDPGYLKTFLLIILVALPSLALVIRTELKYLKLLKKD